MSSNEIEELKKEIEELRKETEELKQQVRIVAQTVLDHIKGKLTIEDVKTCYQVLVELRRYLQGIPTPARGGGLEDVIAQLLSQKLSSPGGGESLGEIDPKLLERLRAQGQSKNSK